MKPIGFIVPAQPVGAKVPPSGPGWLHEIKHDGFRLIGWRNSDRVRLLTRNGTDFTDRFPLVAEAIRSLRARSCLIDGQIAVPRFSSSSSSTSSIRFDNSGESGPPCGVPSSVGLTSPPSITPALRNPRMSFRVRLSATRLATSPIRMSWFTRSKEAAL